MCLMGYYPKVRKVVLLTCVIFNLVEILTFYNWGQLKVIFLENDVSWMNLVIRSNQLCLFSRIRMVLCNKQLYNAIDIAFMQSINHFIFLVTCYRSNNMKWYYRLAYLTSFIIMSIKYFYHQSFYKRKRKPFNLDKQKKSRKNTTRRRGINPIVINWL